MDVKAFSYIIFICITFRLQYTSATSSGTVPGMTIVTEDDSRKCTRKLATCSLKVDDFPVINPGEKGEKGDIGAKGSPGVLGMPGPKGDPGKPGAPGSPGSRGPPGMEGLIGAPGIQGVPGSQGLPGMKGHKGEPGTPAPSDIKGAKGDQGLPGIQGPNGRDGSPGLQGPKGERGLPGPVGPPGIAGHDGICPCKLTDMPELDDEEGEFGSATVPASKTCKFADDTGLKSGNYYMGPPSKPFKVYCNMTTRETCIHSEEKTKTVLLKDKKFWISERGVDIKNIYGLNPEQITWLQARSSSVRQKLKYNCLDSVPYSDVDPSLSVQLLTWNDMVIGPYPSKESPFFYSVPPATNGCKEGSTEWKSTIIELQSSNPYRLPITDMWIGDNRHNTLKRTMYIESVELCFG